MTVSKKWSHTRKAHRRLYSGMRGDDVAQLQHALNHRLEARAEFGFHRIRPDGEFGPATRDAWMAMAKAIGLDHHKVTVGNQELMRQPQRRPKRMVQRSHEWEKAHRIRHNSPVEWLLRYANSTETGHNDAPWLRAWENSLPHDRLDWMIPGNPYCGLGCIAAYWNARRELLPDDTVSTIAIANRARSGNGFKAVSFSAIRKDDLIVFNFGSGGPKHVGLARGPAAGGVVRTGEANTSPGNGGSQSNGGGVYARTRPLGLIHTVARPI